MNHNLCSFKAGAQFDIIETDLHIAPVLDDGTIVLSASNYLRDRSCLVMHDTAFGGATYQRLSSF